MSSGGDRGWWIKISGDKLQGSLKPTLGCDTKKEELKKIIDSTHVYRPKDLGSKSCLI